VKTKAEKLSKIVKKALQQRNTGGTKLGPSASKSQLVKLKIAQKNPQQF